MYMIAEVSQYVAVASFAEAWIEILSDILEGEVPQSRLLRGGVDWNKEDGEPMFTLTGSPPSRRRGLKFKRFANLYTVFLVASFAEAWIEIAKRLEIYIDITSPPSRRRGLKSWFLSWSFSPVLVASFAEAWIEIGNPHYSSRCCYIVSSQR